MDVTELLEWMSYDLSKDEDFIKAHKLEQQKAASADEQYKQFKAFFQGN